MKFKLGDKVQYKEVVGFISFIDDLNDNSNGYISIAIPPSLVRVVVYRSDYKNIQSYGKNS